jgi:phosphoribosyl 1,2-cyclic phosphodiesterase/CheY-like chemotaxis protein
VRVRFWGTRGSIARAGAATLRYGGNTSCVEVQADDGTLVVLDCGTGAHELALDLRRRVPHPTAGHVLIGHAHWDHIQGFPFFEPLYDPAARWDVYAPGDREGDLQRLFAGQMSPEHHPIALGDLRAAVSFHVLKEGSFRIGGIQVRAQYLHHPALTLGYRLEADGRALVYASDHEPHALPATDAPPGAEPAHPEDRRHVAFLAGADLVIHDTQYTRAEYERKRTWGHTPVECAVDYAIAAGARRLALFHHDPERDDAALAAVVALAQRRVAASGAALEVFAAAEGHALSLGGALVARSSEDGATSALVTPTVPTVRTVLLASDDARLQDRLVAALAQDGLRVVRASTLAETFEAVHKAPPSLLLLGLDAPRAELLAACRALRADADPRLRALPVLLVGSPAPAESDVREAFEAGATDYLARPLKPTLLRSRIRGWLLRSEAP